MPRKSATKPPATVEPQWPADAVERWPIDRLTDYERNARTHSDSQIAAIAASIKEFGFTNPVLVTESGMIIAGHARVAAAYQLEFADVPVMVARGWTKSQIQAYVIADNQLALSAGWDEGALKLELGELSDAGFDLNLLGFGAEDLARYLDESDADSGGGGDGTPESTKGNLADRFGVPPFSVLNAREGWWQDRKRAWLALGIQSELGRGDNLAGLGGALEAREAIKRSGRRVSTDA